MKTASRSRGHIDKKLDQLVRQRGSLRAQIALQQGSGSPDAAKIAAYQPPPGAP
jgi:hypothetical protein